MIAHAQPDVFHLKYTARGIQSQLSGINTGRSTVWAPLFLVGQPSEYFWILARAFEEYRSFCENKFSGKRRNLQPAQLR